MQRIADGVAHIGRADMRHQGTIAKPNQRMHHRFRVHQHLDLLRRYTKKLFCFNNLERLIKHRCAIDRNALPHGPIGVRRGLRHADMGQFLQRRIAKGAARCGDDDPLDLRHIFAHQRLKNGGMFAINGQNACSVLLRRGHQQGPGSDQRFLIGQGQCGALLQRDQPRRQPGGTDDGRHHPISRHSGRLEQRRAPGHGLHRAARQGIAQRIQLARIGGHSHLGPQAAGIRGQLRHVLPPRQGDNLVAFGRTGDQIDGILPDRACGPKDRHTPRHSQKPSTNTTTEALISASKRSRKPP